MRLGITINRSTGSVATRAREAERWGFDFVASGEHLFFHGPMPNAFVTLAAAAGATERIRLLSALTVLPLYPAPLAAKLAATLDVVSNGRFELGVGVGGEYPPEFAAVGVPVRERGRRTDAALDVVSTLLAGGTTTDGLSLDPQPVQRPRPPIIIGGRGEAAQRRAGRFGDAWMPYLVTPDHLARGLGTARAAATEHGRPPVSGAVFLWLSVDSDGARARRTVVDTVSAIYQQDFAPYVDTYLVAGTPAQVVDRIREYEAAGAERVLLSPASPPDQDTRMTALLTQEVLPALHLARNGSTAADPHRIQPRPRH